MGIIAFFKKAFSDMRKSAKAQHEVDRAQFQAARAESRARFEEARAIGDPQRREEVFQARREEQIAEADARRKAAEERLEELGK